MYSPHPILSCRCFMIGSLRPIGQGLHVSPRPPCSSPKHLLPHWSLRTVHLKGRGWNTHPGRSSLALGVTVQALRQLVAADHGGGRGWYPFLEISTMVRTCSLLLFSQVDFRSSIRPVQEGGRHVGVFSLFDGGEGHFLRRERCCDGFHGICDPSCGSA